jgi:hypothetical protein
LENTLVTGCVGLHTHESRDDIMDVW